MKHTVRLLALLLVLCVAAVGLFAFTSGVSAPKSTKPILPATASGSAVPAPKPPEPVPEPEPENAVVRLKAVGDNLIHDSIYKQAAK
ncbi:MAG: CapA family protein, partial [Oscillospiraceae bacterium]